MNTIKKDIDNKIVSSLEKLTQVQRLLLWDVAKKEKLSPIQIQFLIYLYTYPQELRNVSSLAIEFDLTKATVSDAVSTLEEKRLLTKAQGKTDKRSFNLEMTRKGKNLVGRIETWKDTLADHIAKFRADDKEKIMIFLMELLKSLSDSGIINVARLCISCGNFKQASGKDKIKKHYCRLRNEEFLDHELNIGCENYSANSKR